MRRFALLLALIGITSLAIVPLAHADTSDFTVTDFTADETLTRADKQGELRIVERIQVDFTDYNHGILRAIPKSYKGNPLRFRLNGISSDSGAPTNVSKSTQNGNLLLKIGDPSRTVTGPQEYTLDYTLDNVISFYGDHDELYWNVNGDQWNQPFTHVQATVHLPPGLRLATDAPRCFAGSYGTSSQDSCAIDAKDDTVRTSVDSLAANQTLTYVVGFQKGFFTPATFLEKFEDRAAPIIEFAVPFLTALAVGLVWWLRSGRDPKGRGTIVPEYAPPKDISPLEAGAIADFKVDNRDLTATFIDLARRGYIRITEQRTDRLLGKDKLTYSLELKNADWSALDPQETKLLSAVFPGSALGDVVSLDDFKNKLYKTATDLRKTVSKDLTTRGFFKQDPGKFATYGSVSFTAVFIVAYIFLEIASKANVWPFIVGTVAGGIVLAGFMKIMPARTAQGVATKESLLGLKMYMDTAEKDRLEKLEGPDAAYAAGAGGPTRTVELFEKLLPYAIVLGVEKQWAGQFNDLYTTPPSWYGGNFASFNAGYLAGSLSDGFSPAVSSSFTSPHSSGSSGFGGGGFSGGGGGGGGGGGW